MARCYDEAMPESDEDPRVVLVTAPDRERGRELARALVRERMAACVNLVGEVTSIYRWEGPQSEDGVEEESEVLLVIKTSARRARALGDWLAREHPYDVPECVSLTPSAVEERYLTWLQASVADVPAS